jgi:hypothetical protein
MKSFTEFVAETVDVSNSPDVRRFITKHIVQVTDHPNATDKQKGNKSAQKDKSRQADYQPGEDKMTYEDTSEMMGEEMSDAQMEKREKIVKSMKKKQGEFKEKYGNKWKDVMYATATKMAMKEQALFEANLKPQMKLNDGSSVKLSESDRVALSNLFDQLSGSNRKRMESKMMEDKTGFAEILRFAKEAI